MLGTVVPWPGPAGTLVVSVTVPGTEGLGPKVVVPEEVGIVDQPEVMVVSVPEVGTELEVEGPGKGPVVSEVSTVSEVSPVGWGPGVGPGAGPVVSVVVEGTVGKAGVVEVVSVLELN